MSKTTLENGMTVQGVPRVVAITSNVHTSLDDHLKSDGLTPVRIKKDLGTNDLIEQLNQVGADVLVTRTSLDVNRRVLSETGLVVVQGACKGPHVDKQAAQELGTDVLKVDTNREQVAQLVLACLMSASAGLNYGASTTRNNHWQKTMVGDSIRTLSDMTVGILGFGDVGKAVAKRLQPHVGTVIAWNHKHGRLTNYYRGLHEYAEGAQIELVATEKELLDRADVLSPHIDETDALGNSNIGYVTNEKLRRLSSDKPGILINAARGVITPSLTEINQLLKEGVLHSAYIDAFPGYLEKEGKFKMPEDAHPGLICTPHIAGSGEHILRKTAVDVQRSLSRWIAGGEFRRNSRVYPHQILNVRDAIQDGAIILRVARSTTQHVKKSISGVIADLGLEEIGADELNDFKPGSDQKWDVVPHLFVVNGVSDYGSDVAKLAKGLDELNQESQGTIVATRFIPTNPTHRAVLDSIDWKTA